MANSKMHPFHLACALLALALGVRTARAQDATAFQLNVGHTGSVSMPGFAPPLKLLWKTSLPGAGLSYPLIVDGMVYVTDSAYQHKQFDGTSLFALDAATGKIKWKRFVNNAQHDPRRDTWSNATYDNGRVFMLDLYNVLNAYDAKTGKLKWSQLEDQYDVANDGSPPTAAGGSVYMKSYSIDEANGSRQWTGFMSGTGVTSPAVGDGGMYEASECNYFKFRLTDGFPLWHTDLGCFGGLSTVPQFIDNQLFVREPTIVAPNSILDAETGATLGTYPQIGSTMVPALYDDGASRFMVVPNGTSLVRYDVTNPASLVSTWSTTLDDTRIVSAPLVVNGYAIAGTAKGGLYVVSPQGETVWSANLGRPVTETVERGTSSPLSGLAAGDGIIVVPTQGDKGNKQALFAFGPG
jgi:outer membrane protein assembly factor BamB